MEEVVKTDFWKKKAMTAMKIRDTDGDGFISKADLLLTRQRYKELGASEEHLQMIDKYYVGISKLLGIEDENVKLRYEESLEKFKAYSNPQSLAGVFTTYFEIIDSNKDGEISFKEWTEYYIAQGIDTKYARASFDAMDTNGDGVVSMEEFVAFNKEFYLTAEDKLHSSILYGPLLY